MSGLGSFKGGSLPSLPSMGGLGSLASQPGGTVSPGLPTLNTNTGTTNFQQMYTNRDSAPSAYDQAVSGPAQPTQFSKAMGVADPNSGIAAEYYQGKFASNKDLMKATGYEGHIVKRRLMEAAVPVMDGDRKEYIIPREVFRGITGVGKSKADRYFRGSAETVDLPASRAPFYTGVEGDLFSRGRIRSGFRPREGAGNGEVAWERGYASGGLVSLGSAYRDGGAVEPQAAPHSPAMSPQPSSPDANPQTERLYMGAMMALDPSYPMSDEDRSMIIDTFIAEFGEDELTELEAEVAARSSDGKSDSIPATLGGKPAALSEGEYVVPADAVSGLGQGSTEAGARRLDDLVRQTRSASAQNVGRPIGPGPIGVK